MRLHDTLTGTRKELLPLPLPPDGPAGGGRPVRIYLCGVTVYDRSHIGHARTITVFDVLRRRLEAGGNGVELVQNFTDVDDKIIDRARAEGTTAGELSARYIREYFEDFDGLNVMRATRYPKATDHIGEIIGLVRRLLDRRMAYVTGNGVYFAVSRFPEYGKLSGKRTGELEAGARVSVDEEKNDPLDFAVWKLSDSEPAWDSPWGRGRPGWHIECSAMSAKYLGDTMDIHGGGRDLIFPHHENEIAQSESCMPGPPSPGRQVARIWMHVGMVTINGEKMSKSLGNVRSVRQILREWGPNVVRLFCLSGHYSKPIDYSEDLLVESLAKWRQVEACCHEVEQAAGRGGGRDGGGDGGGGGADGGALSGARAEFDAALDDDLNTHLALSALFGLVREAGRRAADGTLTARDARVAAGDLGAMMAVLGLAVQGTDDSQAREIESMVADRQRFREGGRFGEADGIRQTLAAMGVELVDRKTGTVWIKRERIGAEGGGRGD